MLLCMHRWALGSQYVFSLLLWAVTPSLVATQVLVATHSPEGAVLPVVSGYDFSLAGQAMKVGFFQATDDVRIGKPLAGVSSPGALHSHSNQYTCTHIRNCDPVLENPYLSLKVWF